MTLGAEKPDAHVLIPVAIESAGATHVGRVRSANQDSILIRPSDNLFVVADGMGGHAGGEIASSLCVAEIESGLAANLKGLKYEPRNHPDPKINSAVVDAINQASTKIYEKALENPALKGMGTTASVLKIVDSTGYVAHVGDSRCYLIRCGYIYQLTNDHSLVSEQVRAGILTKEEAELHQLRNVITRSVGYQEEEDVDTTSVSLEPGDALVLCSDGLHGKVQDREITKIIEEYSLNAVGKLIDLANERGGDDNISVIIVKVKETSK